MEKSNERQDFSRVITDAQQGVHKNLEKVVKKHCQFPSRKPIAEHTQTAFNQIQPVIGKALAKGAPLIFDSCCGTAMSTRILAEENPNALVIGIDRSANRLGKEYNSSLSSNAHTVQAECGDFWQLAQAQGWKLYKHTLFYPNPYPKSKHLKRRWHGHPAFPALLALGGEVECRSNWNVYVEEFCEALNIAKEQRVKACEVECFQPKNPKTLFEKKYQKSAQNLYRCKISL